MPVSTTSTSFSYKPGAAMLPEAIPFQYFGPDDIVVTRGYDVVLTRDLDYAVTGDGPSRGGSVRALVVGIGDETWHVSRKTSLEQNTKIVPHEPVPARQLTDQLDRQLMISQEQASDQDALSSRALQVPIGELAGQLPPIERRKGRFFAFDGAGMPVGASGMGSDSDLREDIADDDGARLIGFAGVDPNAGLRTMLDKGRETRSVEDFFHAGDSDRDTLQRAIDATGRGDQLVFTRRGAYDLAGPLSAPHDGASFIGYNTVICATAGTSYENMLLALGRTGLTFRGIEWDANGPARANGQTIRYMGLVLTNCIECDLIDLTARNTRGFNGIPAVGLTAGGVGRAIRFINPRLFDCGVTGNASDGIFCSTDDSQIVNILARGVTDTAAVLESCNNSVIEGGTVRDSSVAAAITNAIATSTRGCAIRGIRGYNLNSEVTGWIQVGALSSGSLYDTEVDASLVSNAPGYGAGPALYVRQIGTGKIDGVRLRGSIYNAGIQSVLVQAAKNVTVSMDIVQKNMNDTAVFFFEGATGALLRSIVRGGKFGLATLGGSRVISFASAYSGQANYNLYAFNPSLIMSVFDDLGDAGVLNSGAEPGATCSVIGALPDGLAYGGAKVLGGRGPAIPQSTNASETQANLNTLVSFFQSWGALRAPSQ